MPPQAGGEGGAKDHRQHRKRGAGLEHHPSWILGKKPVLGPVAGRCWARKTVRGHIGAWSQQSRDTRYRRPRGTLPDRQGTPLTPPGHSPALLIPRQHALCAPLPHPPHPRPFPSFFSEGKTRNPFTSMSHAGQFSPVTLAPPSDETDEDSCI